MKKKKFLGIDYGERNIGLAISDDSGTLAFPYTVLSNDKNLTDTIQRICNEEGILEIVLGASYNFSGKDNKVMAKIRVFKNDLARVFKTPVHFEPELFTTALAKRIQGGGEHIDASAATLILQAYLDRKKE